MSKYIFYNHQTLTDTIDINIYNSYYSFVQNIFLGGIPMISENKLEKSDLIQRVPVAEDARLKKIILTEKAMILNENISMAINSVENKLSENITLEEINVFYRVLDKIRNNLE